MAPEAQKTLAVALLMALWWITEAIPISATALLPLLLFPLLNVCTAGEAASAYGNLAWYLATADDAGFRDGRRALALAERAVDLDP